MVDPISLAVGAGILVFGLLAGHISGRVAASRRRPHEEKPKCGCGHHLANHDRDTGTCHATWLEDRQEYKNGRAYNWEERVTCSCRQYVGPEPTLSYQEAVRMLGEGSDR